MKKLTFAQKVWFSLLSIGLFSLSSTVLQSAVPEGCFDARTVLKQQKNQLVGFCVAETDARTAAQDACTAGNFWNPYCHAECDGAPPVDANGKKDDVAGQAAWAVLCAAQANLDACKARRAQLREQMFAWASQICCPYYPSRDMPPESCGTSYPSPEALCEIWGGLYSDDPRPTCMANIPEAMCLPLADPSRNRRATYDGQGGCTITWPTDQDLCVEQGNVWRGGECISPPQAACEDNGGTWDPETEQCTLPDTCPSIVGEWTTSEDPGCDGSDIRTDTIVYARTFRWLLRNGSAGGWSQEDCDIEMTDDLSFYDWSEVTIEADGSISATRIHTFGGATVCWTMIRVGS